MDVHAIGQGVARSLRIQLRTIVLSLNDLHVKQMARTPAEPD